MYAICVIAVGDADTIGTGISRTISFNGSYDRSDPFIRAKSSVATATPNLPSCKCNYRKPFGESYHHEYFPRHCLL